MKFEIPLYNGTVVFFNDPEKFQKALVMCGGPGDVIEVGTLGMCAPMVNEKTGERAYLLGVFDGQPRTLVHECGHLALQVAGAMNFDAGCGSGEPFCYLLDAVFGKTEPYLKKNKKRG